MSRQTQLIRLIEAHDPTPEEEPFQRQMLALASSAADSLSRDHFVPGHFTASGFVVSPCGDSLLLVHHRRLGRWLQPGGHIDSEDVDPVSAAVREVQEETAVALAEPLPFELFDIDVHPIPAAGGEPPHAHFDLRFLFRAAGDEIEADDEVIAAAWVPIDEIAAGWDDLSVQRVAARIAATGGTPQHRRNPS